MGMYLLTLRLSLGGCRQCFDGIPPELGDALRDESRRKAKFPFPFSVGKAETIMNNESIISSVTLLNDLGRPLAILFAVVAVAVLSVNRMIGRWSRSHVFVKRREAVCPAFANLDTPPSIARVASDKRIRTALSHLVPYAVLKSASEAMNFSLLHGRSIRSRYTNSNAFLSDVAGAGA